MTDARSIFDTLRPLSGPTTAGEGIELMSDVAAMVAAYTIAKELPMIKTSSRRKSVATMVIAGVIGFGGVAAAGPGGFDVLDSGTPAPSTTSTTTTVVPDDEAPSTTVADQTDTSTTAAPETTDAPASPSTTPTTTVEADDDETSVLVDDPTTAFDETQCADGNHGKTVSSIAQATEGPNKGQTVRDAAHSSCGKQTKDDSDEAEHDDDSDDSDETDDSDDTDEAEHDDDTDEERDDKGKSKRPKNSRDEEATTPTAATPSPSGNGNGNGKNKDK